MPRSPINRLQRAKSLKARIRSNADDHFARCTMIGCGRLTARAERKGLAGSLCRKHLGHRQRHGSAWCPSPAATTLKPYLKAARTFVELQDKDPFVCAAKAALGSLMESAGAPELATRLRGLPPSRRAKIALARLREAHVKPERLLAIAMAIHALIEDAPQVCHRVKEWRIVAIAKRAHRLSSGDHRDWKTADESGPIQRTTHVYPRSSGRVLRYLGEAIERECELAIDHHLATVVRLKLARYGPHPSVVDPLTFAAKALGAPAR